jgi:23S rRNA (cytidine1920-2'-O)/16S rRNA (cytidine1409-2'-O)-methyltransferase
VGPDEPVSVTRPPRYVGRGGEKLEAALDRFELDVTGRRALDAGASTGGFTDCLLRAGATSVVAVDVGRHQLHERLRADPRVELREETDIRSYRAEAPFDLVVADLSFISLRTVAGALVSLSAPGGDLVVLIKPQFEVGRAEATAGRGVIRRPEAWAAALDGAIGAIEDRGAAMMGLMLSPLRGADGNVEFLGWFRPGARRSEAAADMVSRAVAEAGGAVAEAGGAVAEAGGAVAEAGGAVSDP